MHRPTAGLAPLANSRSFRTKEIARHVRTVSARNPHFSFRSRPEYARDTGVNSRQTAYYLTLDAQQRYQKSAENASMAAALAKINASRGGPDAHACSAAAATTASTCAKAVRSMLDRLLNALGKESNVSADLATLKWFDKQLAAVHGPYTQSFEPEPDTLTLDDLDFSRPSDGLSTDVVQELAELNRKLASQVQILTNADERRRVVDDQRKRLDEERRLCDAARKTVDDARLTADSQRGKKDAERHEQDAARHEQDTVRYEQDAVRHEQDAARYKQDAVRHEQDTARHEQDAARYEQDAARHNADSRRVADDITRGKMDVSRHASDAKRVENDMHRLDSDKRRVDAADKERVGVNVQHNETQLSRNVEGIVSRAVHRVVFSQDKVLDLLQGFTDADTGILAAQEKRVCAQVAAGNEDLLQKLTEVLQVVTSEQAPSVPVPSVPAVAAATTASNKFSPRTTTELRMRASAAADACDKTIHSFSQRTDCDAVEKTLLNGQLGVGSKLLKQVRDDL